MNLSFIFFDPLVKKGFKKFLKDSLLRFKDWVVHFQGMKRNILLFSSGLLTVLSMAPFFISPILFLTFPLLVWMLEKPLGQDLT